MGLFKSAAWWGVAALLVIVVMLYARSRRRPREADAGSTLSPGHDAGSWAMTAALPMCPACMSPLVLRSPPGGQQTWTCVTPECPGVES